jgi:gliding motility-associated-like protein
VYVKDAVGCKNDTTIVTPTYPIKVPNFFTPDGDADNETFTITNIEKYPDAIIRLYDRFGKLLLEAKGSTYTSWDGKYNGHDMPSTDYWYEIYIHEINKTYTGHFTLIRSDH